MDLSILKSVEFVYFETGDRGAVFNFRGENPTDPTRSLKLRFDNHVTEKAVPGGIEKVVLGSIRVNRRVGNKLEPDEYGQAVARALVKSDAYLKGQIRYVPSPEELRAARKRREQEENLAREQALLESSIHGRPNFDVEIEVLREYADSIGAPIYGRTGKFLAKMPLINGICGVLGIGGEYVPKPGYKKKKKSQEDNTDEVKNNGNND